MERITSFFFRKGSQASRCIIELTNGVPWGNLLKLACLVGLLYGISAILLIPRNLPVIRLPKWIPARWIAEIVICIGIFHYCTTRYSRSFPRIAKIIALLTSVYALIKTSHLVGISYFAVKPAIGILNANNYDALLELIERSLFFGTLPSLWLVGHIDSLVVVFFEVCYHLFIPFLYLSTAIAVFYTGFDGGIRFSFVMFIGLYACLLITLAFPSEGPIFTHPEAFTKLSHMPSGILAKQLVKTVLEYRSNPESVPVVAGIAAMPSYHIYAWGCATMWWVYLPRSLFLCAILLFMLNWLASVALGWHYFLDGVAAMILLWIVCRVVERILPAQTV